MNSNVLAFSYLPAKILLHCSWAFAPSGEQPERLKNIKGDCEQRQIQISLLDSTAWFRIRACFKIPWGPVFAEKAEWRGATREHTQDGSVTEEQRSQAAFSAKTLRAAVLLAVARVGSPVTARFGDAPASPPWPQPKSLAAGPHAILKQALSDWPRLASPQRGKVSEKYSSGC